MSAFYYFRTLGEQQVPPKLAYINSANTKVNIWTPTSSMRIVLTNFIVSTNPGGTIQIWLGGNNQIKLAEVNMSASTNFSPVISAWESTATDAPLFAVTSTGGTNGWSVVAEGFELIP